MATERFNILVVDDERFNLNILIGLLKSSYEMMVANTGQKALKAAHSSPPPDLILLDIMMPEMDGYEVCRQLKADAATRDIPVIFVTAMGEVSDETKGFELGAVDYITKPISPPIVQARVASQLKLRQAMVELKGLNDELELKVQNRTAELKKAKEAAESSNKAKSLFISNMSHELLTPINGIIGSTDLAVGEDLSPKMEKIQKTISRSSRALLRTVNTLLDFSKSEDGKLELAANPFRLDEVLGKLSGTFTQKSVQKQIAISFDISANEVPNALIGDPERLANIFNHLLDNAAKFSTDAPKVTIGVRDIDKSAEKATLGFYVKDNGIGIASGDFEKIFNAFTQVDDSHTRQYDGTGMGLAVSKRLVEGMGGTIRVESDLGKGSTFYFTASFERQDQEHPFKTPSTESREDTTAKQKSSETERKMGSPELLCELLSTMAPFIQKRKPKQCKEIMAEVSAYGWPGEYAQDITELGKWIGKYKFKDALPIYESTMEKLKS